METRKVLVVAALVAASIAMAAKDGVTLRKTLTTGTETYHVETSTKQTVTVPGGQDQDMAWKSVSAYTYKIGAVDAAAGQAQTDLTTKVEKVDIDGPLADALNTQKDKLLITTTISGKLDSRNRFVADPNKKIDPRAVILGNSSAGIVSPLIEFPDKAVSIGDSWDVTVSKNPVISKEDQKLTAKYVGDKDVDGKSVYVLSLTGTLKTNIDVGELMKANPVPELEAMGAVDMVITGTIGVTAEATIDKVTGQTLTMTVKLKNNQEIAVAALGDAKIPSVGTATITYTLAK